MKLDKYEIRQNKFLFVVLCFVFLMGVICVSKITDLTVKTVEKEATVVKTYILKSRRGGFVYHSGGPHMNIEWIDASGEVQTEGSLFNKNGLVVGDTFTIQVDAKTQSRRIYGRTANIFMFGLGVLFCVSSYKLLKLIYGKKDY